jgi:GDP-4-dehydro-6-deoxy-D-mannose reductase
VTRIVVTGAAGFAGGHLIEALLARGGVDVEGWRRPGPPESSQTPSPILWREVDVLEPAAVRDALSAGRPAIIYHCAGAPHVGQSWATVRRTLETNVRGTHHILEADRLLQLGARILVTGSAAVYRAAPHPLAEDAPTVPETPYGLSKLAQEQLAIRAAAEGQHVFVTRSFNHIGPRQSPSFAAASFARQIALAEAGKGPQLLKVGNLSPRRDFSDVRDTVRAYMAIVDRGRAGVPYNVCSGVGVPMQSLLDRLRASATVPVTVEQDARLYRPADAAAIIGDPTRLQQDTGWRPAYSLDETIHELLDYWRSVVGAGLNR